MKKQNRVMVQSLGICKACLLMAMLNNITTEGFIRDSVEHN